jgi:hypothetical protein
MNHLEIFLSNTGLAADGWTLSKDIKAGDLLTAFTVLISFGVLITTLWKEIHANRSTQVDRIRAAASKTLGKLERWRDLALCYYEDIQPLFVATSNMLGQEFDVGKARDYLWSELGAARNKSKQRIVDESIETAYVELASYFPGIYQVFSTTLHAMKDVEEGRYVDLVQLCQMTVLQYADRKEGYVPPMLGNDLRGACGHVRSLFFGQVSEASAPIHDFLVALIAESNARILQAKHQPLGIVVPKTQFPSVFAPATAAQPRSSSSVERPLVDRPSGVTAQAAHA